MQPLTCYLLRWDVIPGSAPETGLSLSLVTGILIPMALYSAWQLVYLYIQHTIIDKDPELVTSLRYLTQVRCYRSGHLQVVTSNIILVLSKPSVPKIRCTLSQWTSASA